MDSNIVIDYLGGKLPADGIEFLDKVVNDVPEVSVITKIEVLGFAMPPQANQLLTDFFNDATIHPLSKPIVQKTIDLRKTHKIKLPDAIIAATALVHKMELITRNEADFKKIDHLNVVNPHSL